MFSSASIIFMGLKCKKKKKFHYLSGGSVMVDNNGVKTLYYGYTDNQGSLIALNNVNTNEVEKYAYDPWGARRNPADWTQKDSRTAWTTNRGYTGHEHLDAFGIINMNGRVYDPYTAQFFSPDPYVQAPGDWLNYNRYGYCMGNPFKFVDPSGKFFWIVIGAVVGGVVNWGIHGFQFNMKGLTAFGIGAVGGALATATGGASLAAMGGAAFAVGGGGFVAGAVSAGIAYTYGTMFTSFGNNVAFGDPMPTADQFISGLGISMLTGGVIQGINAAVNGRNFIDGTLPRPGITTPLPAPGPIGIKTDPANAPGAQSLKNKIVNQPVANEAPVVNEIPNEPNPMEGKVMRTVKGPDGTTKFVFEPADGSSEYTKSTLQQGRAMHSAYKEGIEGTKEFRLPSGKRIDFLDTKNGTVYELKPYNPRAINAGLNQLDNYYRELISPTTINAHPELNGISWKLYLETY